MFHFHQNHSTPNCKSQNASFNDSFNGNTPINNSQNNRKSMNSDEKRGVERFRRVKEEEVLIDQRVVDNSFEAKVSVLKCSKEFFLGGCFLKEKEKQWWKMVGRDFSFLRTLIC